MPEGTDINNGNEVANGRKRAKADAKVGTDAGSLWGCFAKPE